MGRKCNLCGDAKNDAEFTKDSHAPDGFQRRCRACDKLMNALRYKVRAGKMTKEEMRVAVNQFKCKRAIERMRAEYL